MALNILDALNNEFGDEIVGMLGKFIGEDSSKTKSALGAVFPAILGGLVNKGSSTQGASEILEMITKGGYGTDTLMGLGTAFSGGSSTKDLLAAGAELLKKIFGEKVAGIVDLVAGVAGIGKNSASSLLGLVVPAVLGFLGREVKSGGLNVGGLMGLLSGQVESLKAAAPAGLGSILGLSELTPVAGGAKVVQGVETAVKRSSPWKWILPLAVIAAVIAYMLKTCSVPPPVTTSVEKAEKAVGEARKAAGEIGEKVAAGAGGLLERLGRFLSMKLPSGFELSVPEFGVERKLLAFIEDAGKPVDKTTWFTFDRLEFETGSATLKASSQEQLKNVAEILKAYPKVALKIGGYTDNVGDPAANLALSRKRAENTVAELVKLGVAAGRLEAEGYGDKHPVADNSTEEGRQKNRRIDMRVTKK